MDSTAREAGGPIAVDDCLIHHPRITTALPALRSLLDSSATNALSTLHLTVGEEGQELLVHAKPAKGLASGALEGGLDLPDGGRVSTTSTTLRWRGMTFRVTPDAFIQVNWAQMDVLYQCVIDALGGHAGLRVVDAYAGIGVLACHLAVDAREVVCIESNRGAAQLGVLNARVNDVADRMHFVLSPVEDALPRCRRGGDGRYRHPRPASRRLLGQGQRMARARRAGAVGLRLVRSRRRLPATSTRWSHQGRTGSIRSTSSTCFRRPITWSAS